MALRVAKEILDLVPYIPGKPIEETQREFNLKSVVKLASNENALGVSPKVLNALRSQLNEIFRYPDSAAYNLTQAASRFYKVPQEWLAFGNGSNELIDLLVRLFCESGDSILTTQAAFIAYPICAQVCRVQTTYVPLKEGYRTNLSAFQKMWTSQHKIVFVPNPNNPTGTYVNRAEVEEFLRFFGGREDVVVVFDEAYVEFVRASDYPEALEFVKKYPNVMILRTTAKAYGLAGLRLGALIARPEVTSLINRIRNAFNVNLLAQAAGVAAFEDQAFVEQGRRMVWEGLDYFYRELGRLGLPYVESQGNFVFFDTLRDSGEVYNSCLREGLILRPVKNYGFDRHLRMTVGQMADNQFAIQVLEKVLAKIPASKRN